MLFGECGGRILYHPAGATLPEKYHLWLAFTDGSSLTAMTQMWGAMELYESGQELERQYIKGMRPTPTRARVHLRVLLRAHRLAPAGRKTQRQRTPDAGAAHPRSGKRHRQDILFRAGLHPKRPIGELSDEQRRRLYDTIESTVREVIAGGGRCDESDLFNHPGGYVRLMDSKTVGRPCPVCGTPIEKLQYLGGACYLCPRCQPAATN